MRGLGLGIGADVADHDRAVESGEDDGDARAAHAGEKPHLELRRDDTRTSIAREDRHVRLALLHQIRNHVNKAARLGTNNLNQRIIHLNHLRRGNEVVTRLLFGGEPAGGEAFGDDLLVADEEDAVVLFQQRRGFPAAL